MGGWDFYCFICAGGFHIPFGLAESREEEDIDFEDNYYDPETREKDAAKRLSTQALFSKEKVAERLQWLTKFRTIGQNRHASGITLCYISGPAEEEEYGQARIQRGGHPNARNLEDDRVDCYGEEAHGDLPVHDNCFALLCRVFARDQGCKYDWRPDQSKIALPFNLDFLFDCLGSVRGDGENYLLLEHGLEPDQYFDLDWKDIFDHFDPLEDVEMQVSIIDPVAENTSETATRPTSGGLLDTLPHELLTQIIDSVPQEDLLSLMRASSTIRRATKSNTFWQQRLRLDAPWLWEFQSRDDVSDLNWQRIYNAVMMQTYKPLQEATKGNHVSGLANRKRIWHVCEHILGMYLETYSLDHPKEKSSSFEEGVTCRYLPQVAATRFQETQTKSEAGIFFANQEDMHSAKQLRLRWTADGELCGISLTTASRQIVIGVMDCPQGTESHLEIPFDDWIEKVVLNISVVETRKFTSNNVERSHGRLAVTGMTLWQLSHGKAVLGRDEGCKRLLEPLPQNGIVGLKSQVSQGIITHLGLLEHPSCMTKSRPANDAKVLDLLWQNHLPPGYLRFKDDHTGYWTFDSEKDMVPTQTLIFGATEIEQSTMVGFSSTADLRYLRIQRSDGTVEEVGQCDGPLKTFPIDGPGGERIAGLEMIVGYLPVGLTLVTTHGRQAVFGRRKDNFRREKTSEYGYGVAGLYCSSGYNSTGKDQLSSVGLIQSPHIQRLPMDQNRLEDGNNLLWEPKPPLPTWGASGPVYGAAHQGEVAVCIDLSRPISRIEGLYPAPEWLDIIELGGFTIHYADNHPLEPLSHLGFPPQQWPSAEDATPENLQKMQRHPGMSRSFARETDHGTAHVGSDQEALGQSTTWNLSEGGEKIVAVSVWAGEFLHGIQFHSESGERSPRWGKCGGEASAVIHAGGSGGSEGGGRIVGLTIILGARRLGYCAVALAPQAVQAMYE